MTPHLKKWVLKPLLILLIVVVVGIGLCVVFVDLQQERLVKLALDKVNAQLKGELVVEESSVSLFEHFPYISIALHNAELYESKANQSKPLYHFERVYAGFSLEDIIEKKYKLRRLAIQGGYLHLDRDTTGSINLLKALSPVDTVIASEGSSVAEIALERIFIEQIHLSIHDAASSNKTDAYVDKLVSSFKMDSVQMFLSLEGEMEVDLAVDSTQLLKSKHVVLDAAANYDTHRQRANILSAHVKLEETGFTITGTADLADSTNLNLRIIGDNKDFSLVSGFLPADVKEEIKMFNYDGRLHFDARIQGILSDHQMPLLLVNFGCEKAWIHNTTANKKVEDLGFKGYFTNGAERSLKTSEVHIINLNAKPGKGVFHGNFVVRDFTNPHTLVQIKSELELQFLGDFFGIRDLKQITGNIKLDMNFKELTDVSLPEESLNKLKDGIQSKLSVENLSFKIPGYEQEVRNMNLHAKMEEGRITLDSGSLRIGDSDLKITGSLSDIRNFLRFHHKPVSIFLEAKSNRLALPQLLAFDTALARQFNDEVQNFKISLKLETTVDEILHPSPLPKGTLEVKNLSASFKTYPHQLKNLGAVLMIEDTTLRLRNLTGMIDSSDFQFSGRVNNYKLWFQHIKKGRTQIAFDFKAKHFAFQDVFTRDIRRMLPRGYRREILNNAWLRTKIDLRYDTIFRFAKAKIANISGDLVKHNLKLNNISGHVKYGARVLILDTLRGSIGRSDFDVTLKYWVGGVDRYNKKRTNYLKFTSKFLDADEISHYDLGPKKGLRKSDSLKMVAAGYDSAAIAKAHADSLQLHHAKAFNVFMIPFSDFYAQLDVGKIKYNKLWLKDLTARLRMDPNQHVYVDTFKLKVAGGAISMTGYFNGSNHEEIYVKSQIDVNNIDLEKMMLKLDHFGQDVVINKNIKGRLSGQVSSYVQIHPDFVPIMSKTNAELNVRIFDGSLVDFAPMQAMSSYFKDKNLRLIRFDTLQNKLTFTNGVLDIPSMDINSSIGYIQMSGKQTLDLSMEYYVRVPMKMVTKVGFNSLFKKKEEEVDLTQVDEIEYVDKDKKIAFMNLKVVGTPDDFTVGLGRDKTRR